MKCYICDGAGHIALDCSKFIKIKGNLKRLEQKNLNVYAKKSVSFNFSDLEVNQKPDPVQVSPASSLDISHHSNLLSTARKPSHMQRPDLIHVKPESSRDVGKHRRRGLNYGALLEGLQKDNTSANKEEQEEEDRKH